MQPRSASPDFAGRDEVRDQRAVQCCVEPRKSDALEPCAIGTEFVGVRAVERGERFNGMLLQRAPMIVADGEIDVGGCDAARCQEADVRVEVAHVAGARKAFQVDAEWRLFDQCGKLGARRRGFQRGQHRQALG